jgi:hypothetical protein
MKRTHGVLAAIAVVAVVAAVAVVINQGDNTPTKTPATAEKDLSSQLDGDKVSEQAKEQATALKRAQDELARKVDAQAGKVRRAQRHELRVTIREESPYDAYKPGNREGECVRATNVPSQLIVMDASGKYPKNLAEPEIPATARRTPSGACEATISVNVPFASRYRLGVAIEGHGISLPTDPGDTDAKVATSPQAVVVLR